MTKILELSSRPWKTFVISDLFCLKKGKRLTKANMKSGKFPFIGAIDKNNGVSAFVSKFLHQGGTITVSYNGSVGEAFFQPQPFWASDDVNVLYPKFPMNQSVALFICTLIRQEKYRFNYGRKWHLERMQESIIQLPIDSNDQPDWQFMNDFISSLPFGKIDQLEYARNSVQQSENLDLTNPNTWKKFEYQELFEIERGRGPRKKDLDGSGSTPFITSIDKNNGLTNVCNAIPFHQGNVISVNRNGSVGEAFYQPIAFCSTEDVHIFKPKFTMTSAIGLFLVTLIRKEKYRFSYGRKWGIERMKKSIIRLPVDSEGQPDWVFVESYIKSLPYSSQI